MKASLLILLTLVFYLSVDLQVSAQELSSPNYKLQFGDFNMTSGTKSSELYRLEDVVGENTIGVYSDGGYFLKAGTNFFTTVTAFRFSIEPNFVRFSSLFPDQPAWQNLTLTVYPGESSYQILAAADDELKNSTGNSIPSTVCDDPTDPCLPTKATAWQSPLSHGFGFTLIGNDALPDFEREKYRTFAKISQGESSVQIISSNLQGSDKRDTILRLKVNIGEDQTSGIYQNTLRFVAMPGY